MDEKIRVSDGTTKYYSFWNEKAEEVCGDEGTLSKLERNVTIIQGAIYASWVLKKMELLMIEVDKVWELAKEAYLTRL